MRRLIAFARLARPHFLLGGIALYALGAIVARRDGAAMSVKLYLAGQIAVTAIQLMTHFLNEYWDFESDKFNRNRTLFSGGSGVLPDPTAGIPRRAAAAAAVGCLAVGVADMLAASAALNIEAGGWIIFALAAAGAWFYSSPPLALAGTGFGELSAALVVSFFVPAFAYRLQTQHLSWPLALLCAPLVALNWAMITIFEFPDDDADRAAGKRTVLSRLGHRRARAAVAAATFGAFALLGAVAAAGLPLAAMLGATALPLAVVVIAALYRSVRYGWLTFGAITLFATAIVLISAGVLLE